MFEQSLYASLRPGLHYPIYLWAGPGTIRMNQLKFLNAPVDEQAHLEAYTPPGAVRLVQELKCNWVYLSYSWGFPPEVEQEDWYAFQRAAEIFHDLGVRVFAYIQTSNCVFSGSFKQKDWFARDPWGRPFYYYTGRYMTCWLHPEWQAYLKQRIEDAIARGADGIFFDNLWFGAQPFLVGSVWLGVAGCHCKRCRRTFYEASGVDIPTLIDPTGDERSRAYLRWRAEQVTQVVTALAAHARAIKPDVVISANNFDVVMRPSYLIYGIDLGRLCKVQDVMMIEDYGLPRWIPGSGHRPPILINNAITLRVARLLCSQTPLSTLPYAAGIGVDAVYTPRQFKQVIAEAAACHTAAVIKGTEFKERGAFTLLTAQAYASQRRAVGMYQQWLKAHSDLLDGVWENQAKVGVCLDSERLWFEWPAVAPKFFGIAQGLTALGVPWTVVHAPGKQDMLVFDVFRDKPIPMNRPQPAHTRNRAGLLQHSAWLRRLASALVVALYGAYFEHRLARKLGDALGLVHFFAQKAYFTLPSVQMQEELRRVVNEVPSPRAEAEVPVLVEHWRSNETGEHAIWLVNYANEPQIVTLSLPFHLSGFLLSPDHPSRQVEGCKLQFRVDVLSVLVGK